MRNPSPAPALTALVPCAVLAAALAGCTASPAPKAWLASPQAAESTAFGGWVVVELERGGDRPAISGELIAIGEDSIHVLSASNLVSLALTSTDRVSLWGYDSQWHSLGTWTAVGTVSAASHGLVLAATGPLLWIIPGSLLTGAASRDAVVSTPRGASWKDLRAYSRFPAGLPPDLDRAALRPKPAPAR
jgi:hypothetical protein